MQQRVKSREDKNVIVKVESCGGKGLLGRHCKALNARNSLLTRLMSLILQQHFLAIHTNSPARNANTKKRNEFQLDYLPTFFIFPSQTLRHRQLKRDGCRRINVTGALNSLGHFADSSVLRWMVDAMLIIMTIKPQHLFNILQFI